jgi:hypothetical protein
MLDSPQTKFVAISGLVALMVGTATTAVVTNVAKSLYFFIGYLILVLIGIVDISCVLSGGCEILSWVKTMLMFFIFLISLIVFSYAIKLKKAEIEFQIERRKSEKEDTETEIIQ